MAVQRIHFVWLQGEANLRDKQPQLWAYVQTWFTFFPNWAITIWDDTAIRDLIQSSFEPAVLTAYDKLPKLAMKSDVGRYAVVYAHGGMYVDTDMECLRNFEHLLSKTDAPNALFSHDGHILEGPFSNNCWFYFPSKHGTALRALLRSISLTIADVPKEVWATASHGLVFKGTGPVAFMRALQAHPPVDWISRALLEPVTPNNLHLDADGDAARARFPDAYAIHHPRGSWMNINGPFLKWFGSTYGRLRAAMPIVFPVVTASLLIVILILSIFLIVQARKARRPPIL